MREFFNRLFRNEEGQDSERSSGSQGTAAETDASDTPAQPRVSAQGERLVIPTRRGVDLDLDSDSDVDFNERNPVERGEATRILGRHRPQTELQNTSAESSVGRSGQQQERH